MVNVWHISREKNEHTVLSPIDNYIGKDGVSGGCSSKERSAKNVLGSHLEEEFVRL